MPEPTPEPKPRTGQPTPDDSVDWPRIRGVTWTPAGHQEITDRAGLASALADPGARIWVDVTAPAHVAVHDIGELLTLHPLIIEDIAERNQRAKIEEIDGTLHVVLFALHYEGAVGEIEVDLVLNHRSLLTVHEPGWDPFAMPQLRPGAAVHLKRGPDFLLYALADGIVDAYFPVLDRIEDEIDALQDDVIRRPTSWTLERLFALKRELIGLRRAITPEVFNQLTNRDSELVADDHLVYFRDVYDHLIRVTDELDNDRELVAGTLEVYLSTVNNNLSTIMKRLTGVTVILAGIGAVAGVFGMSEAALALGSGEGSGFWVIAGLIVLGAAVTAIVLRRIDWI
jgi:magnesium transporter